MNSKSQAPTADWLDAMNQLDALVQSHEERIRTELARKIASFPVSLPDEDDALADHPLPTDSLQAPIPLEPDAGATAVAPALASTVAPALAAMPAQEPSVDEPDADEEPEERPAVMPSSRLDPLPTLPNASLPDFPPPRPGEEVEVAWASYSPRSSLPGWIGWSAVIVPSAIYGPRWLPASIVMEGVYAPCAAIALLLGIRTLYRLFAYHARLTNRRLFVSRGWLYPREAPLNLAAIVSATAQQTALERVLGVGTVTIQAEPAETGTRVLPGIAEPVAFAAEVERQATARREASLVVGRAPRGWVEPLSGRGIASG